MMTNPQLFTHCINQILPLSAQAEAMLLSVISERVYRKKEHLLQIDQINTELSFIIKGSVREYLLNENDQEITVWLGIENDFAVALPSFITQKPSKTAIQAIEDIEVIQLSHSALNDLFDQSHEIERLGRIITEQALINVESYHYEFHYLTAQERYQNLLKNRPTILQKVSLQIIASYLGVSNETLSRIRAKRL